MQNNHTETQNNQINYSWLLIETTIVFIYKHSLLFWERCIRESSLGDRWYAVFFNAAVGSALTQNHSKLIIVPEESAFKNFSSGGVHLHLHTGVCGSTDDTD